MDYTVKHVTAEQELDKVLDFDRRIFGLSDERDSPYSREEWLGRMENHSNLMLYAEADGEVIGLVLGRVDGKNITVGSVAVDEKFRKYGIARELMLLLEERAVSYGINQLGLGAVESAENFYEKLGYIGTLLIQSEEHSIEELLALNTKYPVKGTSLYNGAISQVYLELPAPDRELQRKYETALPGCYTQMMFWKNIKSEEELDYE